MFCTLGIYAHFFGIKTEDAVEVNVNIDKEGNESVIANEKRRFISLACDAVCGNAPYLCKVAFCSVIIERCNDPAFPNTPAEIVFSDPEFILAHDLDYDREPTQSSLMAYDDAINGFSPCPDALYYSTTESRDITLKKRQTLFRIGKYIFS